MTNFDFSYKLQIYRSHFLHCYTILKAEHSVVLYGSDAHPYEIHKQENLLSLYEFYIIFRLFISSLFVCI